MGGSERWRGNGKTEEKKQEDYFRVPMMTDEARMSHIILCILKPKIPEMIFFL